MVDRSPWHGPRPWYNLSRTVPGLNAGLVRKSTCKTRIIIQRGRKGSKSPFYPVYFFETKSIHSILLSWNSWSMTYLRSLQWYSDIKLQSFHFQYLGIQLWRMELCWGKVLFVKDVAGAEIENYSQYLLLLVSDRWTRLSKRSGKGLHHLIDKKIARKMRKSVSGVMASWISITYFLKI